MKTLNESGSRLRSGRLVRLCVQISDLSANLARVSELITELGGNIIEVEH